MQKPAGQNRSDGLEKRLDFGACTGRAQVAQLVEQRIENPRVGSSILSLGTKNY